MQTTKRNCKSDADLEPATIALYEDLKSDEGYLYIKEFDVTGAKTAIVTLGANEMVLQTKMTSIL